ncbi:MAG: sodium/solute symporter [Pseudomonadota bacterium]
MENFGTLNWAIVVAYLVANLLLGYVMSGRVKTSADYQLGDRSAPWWAIGISVVATYVSALSFLGGPAWAYGDGMAALAIHVNYPLVIFVVVVVFMPFFYNSGVASIYEYLERRFGPGARAVMALIFLITQLITTASIVYATAVVIDFATGFGLLPSIIGMTAIVLLYTLMGGMNAVIWTDVLQGAILFLGAGVVLFGLIAEVSPLSQAFDQLASADKLDPIRTDFILDDANTIWAGVFAMTLYHITVYGTNQMMVQRALAAKTLGDAKKSYLMMGYAAFFIYFLFFFIGALLWVHFQGREFDNYNTIILIFASALAIPGLLGIITAAVLSASMSSLSSALNALATISVTDFYKRYLKREARKGHFLLVSRILTVVWALAAIPVALWFANAGDGSILEALTKVSSFFVGAKLSIFGMGFFSKHTTERGLLIGVLAGFVGLFLVVVDLPGLLEGRFETHSYIAWPWYVVIGAVINIVVAWSASVLLDGFKTDWHPQTVVGQQRHFRTEGLAEKQDGWFVVPGKVDGASWGLLGFFALTIIVLSLFATLGSA